MAIFHVYESGIGLVRDAGKKCARKRRIRILAIHAIEDQDVFAGADVIEFEFAGIALKGPEAGLGIVVAIGAIEFDGSEIERFAVGTDDAAANFSGGQSADVVLEAGAVGNFERRQAAFEGLLAEFKTRG